MRTFQLLVLVSAITLLAAPGAADETALPKKEPAAAVVTLREAATEGHLEVEGFKPTSYRRVHLRIKNLRSEPMNVDICGSYLEPRTRGSCQRLGIGPVVTPRKKRRTAPSPRPRSSRPGSVIVSLGPLEQVTVEVNTCCLDSGKPAPRNHAFRVAKEKLPPVREKVLRWWADHPETPQYAVNTAIWQFREDVRIPDPRDRVPAVPPFTGVAGHAGILYRLRSGELMSLDPDGIERFLGTEIRAVHPTDSAIYAEAYGPDITDGRGRRRGRSRELWRLVPTGEEPWALVAFIPEPLELKDLQVAPSGAVLVTTNRGLYRVDVSGKRFVELVPTKDTEYLSVRFDRKGKTWVTLREPAKEGYYQSGELKGQGMAVCELWELDLKTGKREKLRSFWNVRQVKAGAAGLYALTPAGKLRRLVGRSFKNAPGQLAYERILQVGRTCVWLESKKGRLVAVDKTGRHRFAAGPVVRTLTDWDLDRHSDDVVYLRSGRYYRLDASRGKSEALKGRED